MPPSSEYEEKILEKIKNPRYIQSLGIIRQAMEDIMGE